jgi:hypothetical protein
MTVPRTKLARRVTSRRFSAATADGPNGRQSIDKLYRQPTFDAGSRDFARQGTFARFEPRRVAASIPPRLSFENRVMRASKTLTAS